MHHAPCNTSSSRQKKKRLLQKKKKKKKKKTSKTQYIKIKGRAKTNNNLSQLQPPRHRSSQSNLFRPLSFLSSSYSCPQITTPFCAHAIILRQEGKKKTQCYPPRSTTAQARCYHSLTSE